jgi:uncharacterized protein DUF664
VTDVKAMLLAKLQQARAVMLLKVDGLDEYDLRRPMTPTGTNLLGLVKHLTGLEYGYLGDCFNRPAPEPPPWVDDDPWSGSDMFASAEESRELVIGQYKRACAHADQTVADLHLESPGRVPWWAEGEQETTLAMLLIRMVAETAQHAGHADIVRELIDGQAGNTQDQIGDDPAFWREFTVRIQAAADHFRP